MVDEDFVMGYVTGYNDGVGSGGGGSGGSLDDYPVFPKKFRFGDSDFYFMVGDINTGFYDSLGDVRYDTEAGAYSFNNAFWYRSICVILCKGDERFAAFYTDGDTLTITRSPSSGGYAATWYLDDVSCAKVAPSSSTGEWYYILTYDCHCDNVKFDGTLDSTYTQTFTKLLYNGLYFNDDGTVERAPSRFPYYTRSFRCLNNGYYAELMNLMLTVPDIIEEV